tara:strand:+ start:4152 stop:4757 length:606 start_codon:yes stop_codon:yes gene_type:complete
MNSKDNYAKKNEDVRIQYLSCSDINTKNRLNYNLIVFNINNYIENITSYLDIGSQEGQFAEYLNTHINIKETNCLDINDVSINNGRKRYPQFNWFCCNIKDFITNKKYQVITINNSFFYFFNKNTIQKIFNMLEEIGYLFISYGDSNWKPLNITDNKIIKTMEEIGFNYVNSIKSFEKVDTKVNYHITANRWYTCLVFKKN